jgi:hypothetical protein
MSLWYVLCKPCTYLVSRLALSPNGLNRAPLVPRDLGVPSGASKMIYEPMVHLIHQVRPKMIFKPMVRLRQTVHLSCIQISTISNWAESSFHLSLVTKEYHRVHIKRFLSRWYVRCKPCTYLAPTLTLSLNGLKRDST